MDGNNVVEGVEEFTERKQVEALVRLMLVRPGHSFRVIWNLVERLGPACT